MVALPKPITTADEFVAWDARQPKEAGRFELIDGIVVMQQSERSAHLEAKANVWSALRDAIRRAGLPCRAVTDGATVRVSRTRVFKPDALVYCGPRVPPDTVEFPEPVVVVEVVSPDSAERDHRAKLEGYFSLAGVQHYLIVDPEAQTVIHHRRGPDDDLLTRVRRTGELKLDPPGLEVPLAEMFETL